MVLDLNKELGRHLKVNQTQDKLLTSHGTRIKDLEDRHLSLSEELKRVDRSWDEKYGLGITVVNTLKKQMLEFQKYSSKLEKDLTLSDTDLGEAQSLLSASSSERITLLKRLEEICLLNTCNRISDRFKVEKLMDKKAELEFSFYIDFFAKDDKKTSAEKIYMVKKICARFGIEYGKFHISHYQSSLSDVSVTYPKVHLNELQ